MDINLLLASLIFGMIGMGMFMYGKSQHRMVVLGAGAGLMLVPYFISNLILLLVICTAMMALPWVVREA